MKTFLAPLLLALAVIAPALALSPKDLAGKWSGLQSVVSPGGSSSPQAVNIFAKPVARTGLDLRITAQTPQGVLLTRFRFGPLESHGRYGVRTTLDGKPFGDDIGGFWHFNRRSLQYTAYIGEKGAFTVSKGRLAFRREFGDGTVNKAVLTRK